MCKGLLMCVAPDCHAQCQLFLFSQVECEVWICVVWLCGILIYMRLAYAIIESYGKALCGFVHNHNVAISIAQTMFGYCVCVDSNSNYISAAVTFDNLVHYFCKHQFASAKSDVA